jgi:FixJ family two-component response regulator
MKTIYILENNTYLKQQISITLEKAGYETVFFSSADEFFSENKKHIADLLIPQYRLYDCRINKLILIGGR